jgi:hypothetical protein
MIQAPMMGLVIKPKLELTKNSMDRGLGAWERNLRPSLAHDNGAHAHGQV